MEEFIGDKRSKAYRAYKEEFNKQNESKSKGLGDTIAKITKATGIDKAVKAVADFFKVDFTNLLFEGSSLFEGAFDLFINSLLSFN